MWEKLEHVKQSKNDTNLHGSTKVTNVTNASDWLLIGYNVRKHVIG